MNRYVKFALAMLPHNSTEACKIRNIRKGENSFHLDAGGCVSVTKDLANIWKTQVETAR